MNIPNYPGILCNEREESPSQKGTWETRQWDKTVQIPNYLGNPGLADKVAEWQLLASCGVICPAAGVNLYPWDGVSFRWPAGRSPKNIRSWSSIFFLHYYTDKPDLALETTQ